MEFIKRDLRCADCCLWGLKRDKNGVITGEHICSHYNQLRSGWQPIGYCSFFINRFSAPNLYEGLANALAEICLLCIRLNPQHEDCESCEDMEQRHKALAEAKGKRELS